MKFHILLATALGIAGVGAGRAYAQLPAPAALSDHIVIRTSGERTTLDRHTGKLMSTVNVSLFNLGGRTLNTPYHAVVAFTMQSGTVAQVEMPGALGGPAQPPYNSFYIDLSAQFPQGVIAPNAAAQTTLTFVRDREVRFSYEIIPYASLVEEHPPTILVEEERRGMVPFQVDEGQVLQFPVFGDDPDGDFVTLAAAPTISNASFVASNGVNAAGTFVFAPNFDQAGVYAVAFTAYDPLGLSTSGTAQITVNNVNRPPTLTGPTNATVDEGGVLVLALNAVDPDGGSVTTLAAPLPANAVFVGETATLYFSPDFTQSGVYDLSVYATDGAAFSATQILHLAVADVPQGTPGDTNGLTLVVDAVPPLSLLAAQHITGAVNNTGGVGRAAATMALITGVNPANGTRGQTLDVTLTGQAAGLFATHFDAGSAASFGGISVDALVVSNATLAVATITIGPDAPLGPRNVAVTTSNEFAVSIVAFNVMPGTIDVSGTLVDLDTTNGIGGAIITVQGTGFTTVSAPDGTFSLNGLPPGDYTLIINPPNHALLVIPISGVAGQDLVLSNLTANATVFDPAAPASVSLLSVLGRGLADLAPKDTAKLKQTILDALLLTGGPEAGVLDEFGNQLNSAVVSNGLMSLKDEGLTRLTDHAARGETFSLADILLPFSFAFEWGATPRFTLADWLEAMQHAVDEAWAAPNIPDHYLPILMFSQGNHLSPTPPTLTPETRLTQVQANLFVASMLSYMVDPQGTNVQTLATAASSVPRRRGALADPPPAAVRQWTGYWRAVGTFRGGFMEFQRAEAYLAYNQMAAVMTAGAMCGSVLGQVMVLPLVGLLEARVVGAFFSIEQAQRVPQPPVIVRQDVISGVDSNPMVFITFRRSPSDPEPHDGRMVYTLYRFRNFHSPRDTIDTVVDTSAKTNLVLFDLSPHQGASFYALTLTRFADQASDLDRASLSNAVPWWNVPMVGINDPLVNALRSSQKLVSDYSEPALVNGGPPASQFLVSGLTVHTNGTVYYSDTHGPADTHKIVRVPDLGRGEPATLAFTGFKTPGHQGLAIDKAGNLYTRNVAADDQYGGRYFKFPPAGGKEFVGSINYYSRELAFANPVFGGPCTMGPPASPGFSDQDLYVVDTLARQLKRIPVRATADPYRRVGQPYADYPFDQQCLDIGMGPGGRVYMLAAAVTELLDQSELGLDIADAEAGGFVPEGLEKTRGTIARVFEYGSAADNRRTDLRLHYGGTVDASSLEFYLELSAPPQSPANVRIYKNGVVVLDGDTGRVRVAADELDDSFWVDAVQGGVMDIVLRAYFGADLRYEDVVRLNAIPGARARPGRHLYVNPGAVSHTAPYNDFDLNAAETIAEALAVAQADDNILVAREVTNNLAATSLTVPARGILLAGLTGRFQPATSNEWGEQVNYDWDFQHPLIRGNRTQSLLRIDGQWDVQVSGFHIEDGGGDLGGGGIRVVAANNVSIGHCAFLNNRIGGSGNGGAILYQLAGSGTVARCRFGRAPTERNQANGNGGALAAESVGLVVRDCVFTNNATLGAGGAIWLGAGLDSPGIEADLARCEFHNNISLGSFPYAGGALHAEDTSFRLADSRFEHNTAVNGGAVSGRGPGLIAPVGRMTNVFFRHNSSGNAGGAVLGYGLGETCLSCDANAIGGYGFEIHNGLFTSNTCDNGHGAALFVTALNSFAQVADTDFLYNRASGSGAESDGGAVAACSLAGTITASTFNRCLFEFNVSKNGGGAIYHTTGGRSSGADLEFYSNTAEKGGALEASELSEFNYRNVIIGAVGRGNTATDRGGGIFLRGSRLILEGDDPTRCRIVGNLSATRGGAISTQKPPSGFPILDVGTSSDVSLTRVTISDNEARHGGAIYIGLELENDVGNDITLSQCLVERNVARNDEPSDEAEYPWVRTSGIYLRQNSPAIKDSTHILIRDTILRGHAGAALTLYNFPLHHNDRTAVVQNDVKLENTRVEGNGMGLQWQSTTADASVQDGTFAGNVIGSAHTDVLAIDSRWLQFKGVDFDGSAGTAGGLVLSNTTGFLLENCDLVGYTGSRFAIQAVGGAVDARSCFWGDAGGPDNPPVQSNPAGSRIVGTNVVYTPYLVAPYD